MSPSPNFGGLTRRSALSLGAAGLSIAMIGRPALAADPAYARKKFVVIICRGAMDGLSVSPPIGDANYQPLRQSIAIPGFEQPNGALKLDETFGLHPKLKTVHTLAQAGQARIAPAVAIPVHIRSHFEAQDILENGADSQYALTTGWLNRTLQAVSRTAPRKALAVSTQEPLILRGPIETASWSPGGYKVAEGRVIGILQDLYAKDPLLGPAFASGLQTEALAKALSQAQAPTAMVAGKSPGAQPGQTAPPPVPNGYIVKMGKVAGGFLNAPDGPSIMAISLDGFDTHAAQGASDGQLATRLAILDAVIDGLKQGSGPAWSDTVVVAATEFGRTARVNGTRGTDHGTAGTALVVGGAVKPGGIVGDWPTLQEAKLYEGRDVAPTLDVRSLFKGVLADHVGVDRRALDTLVFPNSAGAQPVAGLVRT